MLAPAWAAALVRNSPNDGPFVTDGRRRWADSRRSAGFYYCMPNLQLTIKDAKAAGLQVMSISSFYLTLL